MKEILAAASPFTAILIIVIVFAVVGTLFFIGLRVRLRLEIPLRKWQSPPPAPRWLLWVIAVRLLIVGALVVVGAVSGRRWLLFLGFGGYLLLWALQVFVRTRQALRWRRHHLRDRST